MAHLVKKPSQAKGELPVYFSVSQPVGQQRAQNLPEDVQLVQSYLVHLSQTVTDPGMKAVGAKIKANGVMDGATHAGIMYIQTRMYERHAAPPPDGRVSPAPTPYYGQHAFTIYALNTAVSKYLWHDWPRIDKMAVPEALSMLKSLVARELTGHINDGPGYL